MRRIAKNDLPSKLFKVIKPRKENENGQAIIEVEGEGSQEKNNNYFKVLKLSNSKQI
jgi:hypothetical protein